MTTRAVLFDLDDTLFDHRGASRAALTDVHRLHAAHVDFAAFEQQHSHELEVMHLEVLAGRMSIDDARRENAFGLMMSLNMLIEFGDAFDFTGADFAGWCRTVGFRETRVIPLTATASAAVAYQ